MTAKHLRTRSAAALLIGGVLLLTSACSSSSSSDSKSSADAATAASLTMQLDGPVTSLDPAKGSSFQDVAVAWALYDPLINTDKDGSIIAGLATKWSSTANSATFTLRDGVTCSDGTKLTADMAAASLTHFFDPATAAPFASAVEGAGNTATVTASGSDVTITLASPFSGLLAGMTTPYTGIVCPAGLKDSSMLLKGSSGTGPYTAVSQVAGSSYTFARRDGYSWGPKFSGVTTKGTLPKQLVMKVIADESTRANLQTTGQLQIAGYSSDAWKRVTQQAGYSKVTSDQSDTFLMFNESPGRVTQSQKIRLAITQAIDRGQLNKVQSYGAGKLISNLGQSTYECYDPSLEKLIPKTDVAAAKKTLTGVKINVIGTILLAGGDGNSYVLSALKDAGADVTLKNMNNQAWVSDLFTPKNDWDVTILVFANVPSNLLSGANFFVGDTAPNGQNLSSLTNTKAEAALKTARETTGSESCDALTEFQTDLLENNDVVPLATAPSNVVFASGTTAMVSKGFIRAGTIRVQK
ncbi:ABC transporter substrate-binding protein [soil metagenome]